MTLVTKGLRRNVSAARNHHQASNIRTDPSLVFLVYDLDPNGLHYWVLLYAAFKFN